MHPNSIGSHRFSIVFWGNSELSIMLFMFSLIFVCWSNSELLFGFVRILVQTIIQSNIIIIHFTYPYQQRLPLLMQFGRKFFCFSFSITFVTFSSHFVSSPISKCDGKRTERLILFNTEPPFRITISYCFFSRFLLTFFLVWSFPFLLLVWCVPFYSCILALWLKLDGIRFGIVWNTIPPTHPLASFHIYSL